MVHRMPKVLASILAALLACGCVSTEAPRLRPVPGLGYHPRVDRQGERVAFVDGLAEGGTTVFVAEVGGGSSRPLLAFGAEYAVGENVVFSPNGKQVAVGLDVEAPIGEENPIYLFDLEAGTNRIVGNGIPYLFDGPDVLYLTRWAYGGEEKDGATGPRLYRLTISSGETVKLLDAFAVWPVAVSERGLWFVGADYRRRPASRYQHGLYVLPHGSAEPERVVDALAPGTGTRYVAPAHLRADEGRFLFEKIVPGEKRGSHLEGFKQLFEVAFDGSEERQLTHADADHRLGGYLSDGRIVFTRTLPRPAPTAVPFVMNADGTGKTRVAPELEHAKITHVLEESDLVVLYSQRPVQRLYVADLAR